MSCKDPLSDDSGLSTREKNAVLLRRLRQLQLQSGRPPSDYYTDESPELFFSRPWGPSGSLYSVPSRCPRPQVDREERWFLAGD